MPWMRRGNPYARPVLHTSSHNYDGGDALTLGGIWSFLMAALGIAVTVLSFLIGTSGRSNLDKLWCHNPNTGTGPLPNPAPAVPGTNVVWSVSCGDDSFLGQDAGGNQYTADPEVSGLMERALMLCVSLGFVAGGANLLVILAYSIRGYDQRNGGRFTNSGLYSTLLLVVSAIAVIPVVMLFGIYVSDILGYADDKMSPAPTAIQGADYGLFYGNVSSLETLIVVNAALTFVALVLGHLTKNGEPSRPTAILMEPQQPTVTVVNGMRGF